MKIINVAIDGPGGAGKSTVARALAAKYGCAYVDTGAMYRTIGLAVQRAGFTPGDVPEVLGLLKVLDMGLEYDGDGTQRMLLDGEDVSRQIRMPEISGLASAVSAIPEVRSYLLETQRNLARTRSVIMDGRDIGTVVLPQANVKVFLTALPEVRARRRWKELQEKGTPQPFEDVQREMNERDERDSNRAVAPLKPAEDSVLVDSTELSFEQVVAVLSALIDKKLAE